MLVANHVKFGSSARAAFGASSPPSNSRYQGFRLDYSILDHLSTPSSSFWNEHMHGGLLLCSHAGMWRGSWCLDDVTWLAYRRLKEHSTRGITLRQRRPINTYNETKTSHRKRIPNNNKMIEKKRWACTSKDCMCVRCTDCVNVMGYIGNGTNEAC